MKGPSINKIILATDFSDASKNATYHALLETKKHKAKLIAVHVFDINIWNIPSHYYLAPARPPPGFTDLIEDCEKARQRGKKPLKHLENHLKLKLNQYSGRVRSAKRLLILLRNKMLI